MSKGSRINEGTVILGAGLSGLGCARCLPGARIFEATEHPGGHARSHLAGGFAFDQGAHICHSQDQVYLDTISRSAGAARQIVSSRVVNRRHGQWITYPVQNHLHELDEAERIRALTDFVNAHINRTVREPQNYRDWCLTQYGDFLTQSFYADYTEKYWRVPMETLATDWLSGRLLPSQVERVLAGAISAQDESQAVFARFRYPERGGYFSFFRKLFENLPIRYSHRAERIDWRRRTVYFSNGTTAEYDTLASSIPLPVLVRILQGAPESVSDSAKKLRHTQLLCVNIVIARPYVTNLDWFYVYDRDMPAARISVPSNLGREPAMLTHTALQAEIFRRNDEPPPGEAVVESVIARLSEYLGFQRDEITAVSPVSVPFAYVISDHARASAATHIIEWLRAQRIFTMGLYGKWKFIWSDASFRDGETTARAIVGD